MSSLDFPQSTGGVSRRLDGRLPGKSTTNGPTTGGFRVHCHPKTTATAGVSTNVPAKGLIRIGSRLAVSIAGQEYYAGPTNLGADMSFSKSFVAIAAGTMLIAAAPADAQHRRGGGQSRGAGGGESRGANGGQSRGASGENNRAVPRDSRPQSSGAPRVYTSPRAGTVGPRAYSYGSPRAYSYGSPRAYSYGSSRAYSYSQRTYRAGPRGGVVVGRSAPRVIGRRGVIAAPVRFYRPYYAFRPRLSLGFGLWAGFPIAYPYSYGYYDPYYYPYSYSNPYPAYPYPAYPYPASPYPSTGYPANPSSTYPPAPGSIGVQPGQSQNNMGGVSFEITPSTAEVFIDGSYVGTVGEFTPTTQPLGLTPGRHQMEIRAPGYRTMNFDVDIVAGQVIPYQGTMER
jgi:hypothetical protein